MTHQGFVLRHRLHSLAFVLLLLGLPSSAFAVCPSALQFATAISYTVGPNPTILTTGDFNEDGKTDIAVSVSRRLVGGPGAFVGILLGHGDGTFDPIVPYPAGIAPRGLTTGDFNQDGITDLVVANQDGNNVSVLLGQGSGGVGNGTFAPAVNYPSNAGPFLVRTGDFNEDGITDLAIPNNAQFSVSILLGQGSGGVGNGTFGPPVAFPLATLSGGLAVGDFNEDGILDLVATQNFNHAVAVLLGQGSGGVGNGTFAPASYYGAGTQPFDISLADMDADGITDLVVANTGGGGVAFLRGNGSGGVGNGSFGVAQILASGNSTSATLGDVNQDGINDLLVSIATSPGAIRLYRGLGTGLVSPLEFGDSVEYPVGLVPIQTVLASFSDDGKIDCVTTNFEGDNISLLPGACLADVRAPGLTDVRDVPNDQGGKVFLTWNRSSLDVTGGAVLSYRVWRRIPPGLTAAVPAGAVQPLRIARTLGTTIEYWEALATLPAQRLPGYGYTAATTQDSMHFSNPYTAFFVSALTSDVDVFYSSNVDSGYSVDNLPPHGPGHFVGQTTSATTVALHWDASDDADFMEYRLYRGDAPGFPPLPEYLIAAQSDTGFVDAGGVGHTYLLTAVDLHGNESPPVTLTVGGVVAVDDPPLEFALHRAGPNPSPDGTLAIQLALPGGEPARVEVVDAAGRVVAAQWVTGVGTHAVTLAPPGRLPAGIYLVRATWSGRSLKTKAVLLR